MKFTRREIVVLLLLAVIVFPILLFTSQQAVNDNELFWLIFVVGPLGFFIAADPARRK